MRGTETFSGLFQLPRSWSISLSSVGECHALSARVVACLVWNVPRCLLSVQVSQWPLRQLGTALCVRVGCWARKGSLSENAPPPDAPPRDVAAVSEAHPQVGAGSHPGVEGLPRERGSDEDKPSPNYSHPQSARHTTVNCCWCDSLPTASNPIGTIALCVRKRKLESV